jgi:hypothetical protein
MADQRTTVVSWQRDVDPTLKLVAEITDDFTSSGPAWRVHVRQFGVHRLRIHREGIADEDGRVHPDLLTAICERCPVARPDAWVLVAVRDDLFGLRLGN